MQEPLLNSIEIRLWSKFCWSCLGQWSWKVSFHMWR